MTTILFGRPNREHGESGKYPVAVVPEMALMNNPEEISAVVEAAKLFKIAHDKFSEHRYGGNGVLSCCDCRMLGVANCTINGGKELNAIAIAARKILFAVLTDCGIKTGEEK